MIMQNVDSSKQERTCEFKRFKRQGRHLLWFRFQLYWKKTKTNSEEKKENKQQREEKNRKWTNRSRSLDPPYMYIYRAREESEEKRKEKKDVYMIVLYTQIITILK